MLPFIVKQLLACGQNCGRGGPPCTPWQVLHMGRNLFKCWSKSGQKIGRQVVWKHPIWGSTILNHIHVCVSPTQAGQKTNEWNMATSPLDRKSVQARLLDISKSADWWSLLLYGEATSWKQTKTSQKFQQDLKILKGWCPMLNWNHSIQWFKKKMVSFSFFILTQLISRAFFSFLKYHPLFFRSIPTFNGFARSYPLVN
jgi:hypothetical protein